MIKHSRLWRGHRRNTDSHVSPDLPRETISGAYADEIGCCVRESETQICASPRLMGSCLSGIATQHRTYALSNLCQHLQALAESNLWYVFWVCTANESVPLAFYHEKLHINHPINSKVTFKPYLIEYLCLWFLPCWNPAKQARTEERMLLMYLVVFVRFQWRDLLAHWF